MQHIYLQKKNTTADNICGSYTSRLLLTSEERLWYYH